VKGAEDEVVDQSPLAKPDLVLRGMDVDVHERRIQLQVEDVGRVPAVMQDVLEGRAHGVGDQAVPDDAAVDEEELQVRLAAGERWQADPASQLQPGRRLLEVQTMLENAAPRRPPSRCSWSRRPGATAAASRSRRLWRS